MGWWSKNEQLSKEADEGSPESSKPRDSVPSSYSKGQKILLEDTSPKFNAETSQSQLASTREQISLKRAWDTISWQDFSFAKLTSIPCFRDSGLVGFTSMFVTGGVTFLYHKNPSKAVNWSIGGLLLGSIVGWEQCRMRRKRSFQVAQMARETMAAKQRPMVKKMGHDERLKNQWDEDRDGYGDDNQNQKRKPWYKFW
ncbi:COX20 (YDR231C) [Zygosaccharomyces parabailii]|uniref:Cytochrome c oxidase assembly protein COX20, mitochondrial n=1 Tax=Zygosaccharomyces bailii (strain CLIB 213 / ATCC 58445 / CBS 680 / BCRC 21525 / NBRC 1098 / NCYC 1416 / NRRL Y-2227) TaxID=1333698 RepID=A0A8J2T294_ZYGB2|nr:COX20 (YDR231C) [Zygosaccharomyces parabailii]CDF87794.1 BN860_14642g1_1 [Zygosaccharomyces bailii CLIB 213]SJM83563.1 related to Cytochrome c oxidase protein 20, mitochondrial [Zygosaccharomyces bailii]